MRTEQNRRISIRFAKAQDAESICAMGMANSSFKVSPGIRFYEKSEVEQWAQERGSNILLVAESGEEIVGFLYCKVMSHHWAMLDNFYIMPGSRSTGGSSTLWSFLLMELKKRNVTYLSCLVREDHEALARLLRKKGFKRRSNYRWFEFFLGE